MTLAVETLKRDALAAVQRSVERLLDRPLASEWTENGLGWQERWQEPGNHAGFYASCEGLVLLKGVERWLGSAPLRTVQTAVYDHHICPVMNPDVTPTTDHQRTMRVECTSTTMYVAKFLQASTAVGKSGQSPLVQHYRERLFNEGLRRNGTWACTLDSEDSPRICATAEALIALAKYYEGPDIDIFTNGAAFLLDIGTKYSALRECRVVLWAASEILNRLGSVHQQSAAKLAERHWDGYTGDYEDIEFETFYDAAANHHGFYTYNANLLFTKATVQLVRDHCLSKDVLRNALMTLADVARRVLDNDGLFILPNQPHVRFWQHYQAVDLLLAFLTLTDDLPELISEVYMIIKPTHFRQQTFTVENDLAVILMPFEQPWSADVHKILKDTLAARGFRCYRADEDYTPDMVMERVWQNINTARFAIADCTTKNPNVFYELGIAHTIGKKVFMCAQNRSAFPFDVAPYRSHTYGLFDKDREELKKKLNLFIDQL